MCLRFPRYNKHTCRVEIFLVSFQLSVSYTRPVSLMSILDILIHMFSLNNIARACCFVCVSFFLFFFLFFFFFKFYYFQFNVVVILMSSQDCVTNFQKCFCQDYFSPLNTLDLLCFPFVPSLIFLFWNKS